MFDNEASYVRARPDPVHRERRYGKYVRSLRLDTQIDEKKVKANYKDGILELVLPKAEAAKPKKIAIS